MPEFTSQIYSLFPIPVGSYSGFIEQDQLRSYLLTLLSCKHPRQNSQDSRLLHYFDNSSPGILSSDVPLLRNLNAWILSCAKNFVGDVQGYQCDDLQTIGSWVNWADVGAGQSPHSHENSLISGTYYLSFEPGHSPIRFWKPGAQSQPNRPYLSLMKAENSTIYTAEEVLISPSEGTLLLWPSQLLHGYSGNARKGRLSLSFNILPKLLLGGSYSLAISPCNSGE